MSRIWEEAIQRWYETSHTANLEYLDLASKPKVSNSEISHNLAVVYDRLSLFSRVSIKNFESIQETLEKQDLRIQKLESSLKTLTSEFIAHKPLSKAEVKTLVTEIAKQPKLVEAQALQLTENLNQKLDRVEALISKVERWVHS
uniref:ORF I n=1 Tax=Citrus yellow mosaic virus TaxID=174178 RepID=G8FL54_9VIRU|nr:ORF I [Citrus yellow mosaic virus]